MHFRTFWTNVEWTLALAMNNDQQPRNIKSVEFGFELATSLARMSLIRPHIERPSLIGINSSVVRKINIVLGKKYPPNM